MSLGRLDRLDLKASRVSLGRLGQLDLRAPGVTGPTGTTPSVTVRNVTSGSTAAVTATPSDTGVALDFVLPQGQPDRREVPASRATSALPAQRPPSRWRRVPPPLTVCASTALGPTWFPNLRASPEVYNMNLSSTGSARKSPWAS